MIRSTATMKIIIKTTIAITTSTTVTVKTRTMTMSTTVTVKTRTMTISTTKITRSGIRKRTITALMKRQFTTKS